MSIKFYDIYGKYNIIEKLTNESDTDENDEVFEEIDDCIDKKNKDIFSQECLNKCESNNNQQPYCYFFQNFKLPQECVNKAYDGTFSQDCLDMCNSKGIRAPFECNFFQDSQLSDRCVNSAKGQLYIDDCYTECQDEKKSKSKYCSFFQKKKLEKVIVDDKKSRKNLYLIVGVITILLFMIILIKFKCKDSNEYYQTN